MTFIDLKRLAVKEPVPGYRAVFVHSENMTLAYWKVENGAAMPEHSHPHEQVASVVERRFELTISGEKKVLDPGFAAVVPSRTSHSGRAITYCRLNDAFHPVRKEYRSTEFGASQPRLIRQRQASIVV
jgi:quercetin dioxygenase-like cupin family protein